MVSLGVGITVILSLVIIMVLSAKLTGWIRRYAITNAVIDVPNKRSSHKQPTPRGGGLAIVALTVLGIVVLSILDLLELRISVGLLGGLGLVATAGWWDDRRGLSPIVRGLVHVLSGVWFVYWIGGFRTVQIGSQTIALDYWGDIGLITLIAWGINAYNFMDGIDGIAASESAWVGACGGVILALGGWGELALIPLIIAAASIGFLKWNWPPARIFMGDVGSGSLGFLFVSIAALSDLSDGLPFVSWLMILGVFVIDTALTLIRRGVQGERLYEAHRTHAYQKVLHSGLSHRSVTLYVLLLNIPLTAAAIVSWRKPEWLPLIALCVCLSLSCIWLFIEFSRNFHERARIH